MDKKQAIKEAMDKRKKQNEQEFLDKVDNLIWKINDLGRQLRKAKQELVDLEVTDVPDVDIDL